MPVLLYLFKDKLEDLTYNSAIMLNKNPCNRNRFQISRLSCKYFLYTLNIENHQMMRQEKSNQLVSFIEYTGDIF